MLLVREAVECYMQGFIGDASGSSEAQETSNNADSKGQADKVSDGNEDSTGNWTRDHVYFILAKSLSIF